MFQNGKKNGFGIYHYYNGATYEGEWRNDLKEGKGKHVNAENDVY